MVAQVDFYSTTDTHHEAAAVLLCKVIEKACKQGLKVFVHTPSPRHARAFDQLLWTFKETSFVPHQRSDDGPPLYSPVIIGGGEVTRGEATLLANLSPDLPPTLQGFERIVDVAGGADPGLSEGRRRYRGYLDLQLDLKHHRL